MKRYSMIVAIAIATLLLVSCGSKEIATSEEPQAEIKFPEESSSILENVEPNPPNYEASESKAPVVDSLANELILTDYGTKVIIPADWENNISLSKFDKPADDFTEAMYGFSLTPKDTPIEAVQYVGVLCIYSEDVWNTLSDDEKNRRIKLSVIDSKVYAYTNSLFNQYPELQQAELFDSLVIPDEEVSTLIKIEKI